MERNITKNFFSLFVDFAEITLIIVGVIMVSYLCIGQLLEVTGESMDPTLADKEQIIAEKISILYKPLERGDIIIFRHPQQTNRLLVKRVVGLPKEKIMIKSGKVLINEAVIDEPYTKNGHGTVSGNSIKEGVEYTIESDAYVVMGDNREKSTDSREWGAINKDFIIGRALLVFKPISNFRFIQH